MDVAASAEIFSTLFAPTNEAFAKLPAGTVAALLKPENKDPLTVILTDQVVASQVMAQDVSPDAVATVNDQSAAITRHRFLQSLLGVLRMILHQTTHTAPVINVNPYPTLTKPRDPHFSETAS